MKGNFYNFPGERKNVIKNGISVLKISRNWHVFLFSDGDLGPYAYVMVIEKISKLHYKKTILS